MHLRYVYGPGTVFPVAEPEDTGDYRLNVIRDPQAARHPPTSAWSTARATSSTAIAARTRSATPCSRSTASPRSGSGRRTRWTRSGCRREFNRRRLPRVRAAAADPRDPARRRHRPLPSRRSDGSQTRTASSCSCRRFEWGERKEPWLLLRAFNETFQPERAGAPGLQGDQPRPGAARTRGDSPARPARRRRPDLLPLQPRVPALPARRPLPLRRLLTSRSAAARAGTCR